MHADRPDDQQGDDASASSYAQRLHRLNQLDDPREPQRSSEAAAGLLQASKATTCWNGLPLGGGLRPEDFAERTHRGLALEPRLAEGSAGQPDGDATITPTLSYIHSTPDRPGPIITG